MIHKLVIAFDDSSGALEVQGIPNSKITAYGMLEVARDLINEQAKRNMELVKPVPSMNLES